MRIWLYILLGFVVLFIVLITVILSSTITTKLDVVLRKGKQHVIVEIKMLFGMVKRTWDMPFHMANGGIEYKTEPVANSESDSPSSHNQDSSSKTIRYSDYIRALWYTKGFKKWVRQTLASIHLENIRWSTRIALDHAADTAVATGLLHGLKHTLLGWMSHRLIMEEPPQVDVYPIFNGPPQISTEVYCIAKISCGKAIYAGLVLIVRVLKVKGGVRSWQSTLFKA